MKYGLVVVGVLTFVAVLVVSAAVTSPGVDQYLPWVVARLGITENAAKGAANVIKDSTVVTSGALWSEFITDLGTGQPLRTLGMWGRFLPLWGKLELSQVMSALEPASATEESGSKKPAAPQEYEDAQGSSGSGVPTIVPLTTPPVRFTTYFNPRYGYKLDYPESFIRGREPTNGDGLVFTSPDRQGTITVWGSNNALDITLEDEYGWCMAQVDGVLGYHVAAKDWFVVSWVKGQTVYYQKSYIGWAAMNTLLLSYPADQKQQYDPIVTRASLSFTPGDLSEAH
jgi:hypothetical protein